MTSAMSFRIAPNYTADQWKRLSVTLEPTTIDPLTDGRTRWIEAIEVVRSRLKSRFLAPIDLLLTEPYAGFLVLAVDCMFLETLESLIEGRHAEQGHSRQMFEAFLTSRDRFRSHFPTRDAASDFYNNVRVGLMHDGETRKGWLIRTGQRTLLNKRTDGYVVVDRDRFHQALVEEFEQYLLELLDPPLTKLRVNLKRVIDHLCDIGAP
jgi:hypothetical protein